MFTMATLAKRLLTPQTPFRRNIPVGEDKEIGKLDGVDLEIGRTPVVITDSGGEC